MERSEADIVVQRAELFGKLGDAAFYLNQVTLADGERRSAIVERRVGDVRVSEDVTVVYGDRPSGADDAGYIVARRWAISDGSQRLEAVLRREFLRWDPLEILPQPFRLLLSLKGSPRRVWADADIQATRSSDDKTTATPAVRGAGVAVVTFARPGALQ
jgi:hypothetical protein